MCHGHTNQTDRVIEGIRKSYEGRMRLCGQRLKFTAGSHRCGHAEQVLLACCALLRRLHELSPAGAIRISVQPALSGTALPLWLDYQATGMREATED